MKNLVSKGAALLLLAAQNALAGGKKAGARLNDTDIANAIVSGDQIAKDKIMYIRSAQAAANGQQTILDESISKKRGTTNFDKGALPKGRAMVVEAIRVSSMVGANLTADEYSPVITDAGIANGEIYITDESGRELFSGPIGPMLPTAAPTNNEETWFYLSNPILLQAGQTIKINIDFPLATQAQTNVEVAMKGVENVKR